MRTIISKSLASALSVVPVGATVTSAKRSPQIGWIIRWQYLA